MRIGLDFGTSNSAVAHFDGSTLTTVQVDRAGANRSVLPSLLYITRDHQASTGTSAALEYLQHETGRAIRWERRSLGSIEIVVAGTGGGPIKYLQQISVLVDGAAQGRLLQSVKTVLRDKTYSGTNIFGRFYTVDELIAELLGTLKEQAEVVLGQPCEEVVMGRPVKFSENAEIDTRAEEMLYKAARLVGFKWISFQKEPIGAAYLHHISSSERKKALVFDFGGGTLDLTVVEVGGRSEPQILSTAGVLVGGDDLDKRMMQALLKYFGGEGRGIKQQLPFQYLDLLESWQTMPELSRPHVLQELRDLKADSPNPQPLRALETLVTKNLGYSLFREIERVKHELSQSIVAQLKFSQDSIDIREVITRTQFEDMIKQEIANVRAGIDQVLREAHLTTSQIDVVLRTGGSSLVPVFIDMLSDLFGAEKLQAMDPLTSVVGGLAVAAHLQQSDQPRYIKRYPTPENPILHNICVQTGAAYTPYPMQVKQRCYVDREMEINKLPAELSGLIAIRTAYADKDCGSNDHLRFTVNMPSVVFVAYPAAHLRQPQWLLTFDKEPEQIEVVDEMAQANYVFQLYRREFEAGQITLGGNRPDEVGWEQSLHYFVVVCPL